MAKAEEKIFDFINEANDNLEGFEQITTDTMAVPFLKVLQKLSPELDEESARFIKGAKVSEFANSVKRVSYGKTCKVIALKFERYYLEWLPDRGGFQGAHTVEHAEQIAADKTFGRWRTANGNILQETYVYYVLVVGHETDGLMVLSLTSSNIKAAKEWNTVMTTKIMDNGRRAMPYYLVWELSTEYKSNDQGSWYGLKVSFDRYINRDEYGNVGTSREALPQSRVDFAQITDERESSGSGEASEQEVADAKF